MTEGAYGRLFFDLKRHLPTQFQTHMLGIGDRNNRGINNMQPIDALYEQARASLQQGNPELAVTLCEQALDQAPNDSRFTLFYGVGLRRSGRIEQAEPLLRGIVAELPQLALAQHELGLALSAQNRITEAMNCLEAALASQPNSAAIWRDLYHLRAAEGDDVGAADAYRRSLNSRELDPILKKALDLVEGGRLGIAEGVCREYLKRRPHDVDAIRLLAEIGITLGVVGQAILLLERCLELAPDFVIARANYATALARHQRFDDALEQTGILKAKDPNAVSHMVQHAAILSMAGRYDLAHPEFAEIVRRVPDNARILISYGHSLRYGGKGEEATKIYQRAIKADPGAGEAYWALANLKTFKFDDALIATMQERHQSLDRMGPDRFHLAFAIGKALEDRGAHDESFAAYADGNSIKRQFSSYTVERTTRQADEMIEYCPSEVFTGEGHPSAEPIFILGLPRAGSTLLEQILASHSLVEGTAELPYISQIASEIGGTRKKDEQAQYPSNLINLTAEERVAYGQRYLDSAAKYRTDKAHFIDKMPNNWMHIGLIKAILPNATIIDARRHPMAACFANFKQLFARGQEFTYGLEEIGHYYADYMRLMAHWHAVLPDDVMTVQYESVVEDLDTQVRALLEHCKLPFEEQCLRYYEKDRAVRTASSEQVRQPIYRDALSLWQRYESHLDPLKAVLDERGVAY